MFGNRKKCLIGVQWMSPRCAFVLTPVLKECVCRWLGVTEVLVTELFIGYLPSDWLRHTSQLGLDQWKLTYCVATLVLMWKKKTINNKQIQKEKLNCQLLYTQAKPDVWNLHVCKKKKKIEIPVVVHVCVGKECSM